ncbi:MAG: thioredoxin [Patescibacteria group bacterium]
MSGIEFTDANFKTDVLAETGKPVLVDFWATWCGPCKVQSPIIEEIAKEIGDKATVGSMDVDAHPTIPQEYGIMSIPTLIIFKDGKPVWRVAGLQQKQAILTELKKAM